jgi:hypothetical protein
MPAKPTLGECLVVHMQVKDQEGFDSCLCSRGKVPAKPTLGECLRTRKPREEEMRTHMPKRARRHATWVDDVVADKQILVVTINHRHSPCASSSQAAWCIFFLLSRLAVRSVVATRD